MLKYVKLICRCKYHEMATGFVQNGCENRNIFLDCYSAIL